MSVLARVKNGGVTSVDVADGELTVVALSGLPPEERAAA
jgi:hypothetical protein